jgi:hypothetical protein
VNWTTSNRSISDTGLYTDPLAEGTYKIRATSVVDAGNYAEATITVSNVPASVNFISNGTFENASVAPWTGTTSSIGNWSAEPSFDGNNCAGLLGNHKASTETLSQAVLIPSNVLKATLSFYIHIDTEETTTTATNDKLAVQIRSTTGVVLETLDTYSNLNKVSGYIFKSYDLSKYKNVPVQIYFSGSKNNTRQTSFVLDNVSILTQ